MFERLLVLYDFSPASQQALEWAVRLGMRSGSRLKVLHVSFPMKTVEAQQALTLRIRRDIDKEVRLLMEKENGSLSGLEVEIAVGKPAPVGLKRIQQDRPDLVVLGTHGRKETIRILMGSVAEKIVRHSPAPVLVAKKAAWPPQVLLIPVAFDESAEDALLLASELSDEFPLRIELIHVIAPPASLYPLEAVPVFDETAAKKEAAERLQRLTSRHPRLAIVSYVVSGHPVTEICRKAEEIKADVILIPTHGRKGLSRFFMGSVAEQVVRYAPCHVLSFCPSKGLTIRWRFLEEMPDRPDDSELGVGD